MDFAYTVGLPSLVLIAQVDFVLERDYIHTDTQSQTPLIMLPTHRLPLASVTDVVCDVFVLVMCKLQITDLKQLFGADEAFVAYGSEKFHHDDLHLDLAGKCIAHLFISYDLILTDLVLSPLCVHTLKEKRRELST